MLGSLFFSTTIPTFCSDITPLVIHIIVIGMCGCMHNSCFLLKDHLKASTIEWLDYIIKNVTTNQPNSC